MYVTRALWQLNLSKAAMSYPSPPNIDSSWAHRAIAICTIAMFRGDGGRGVDLISCLPARIGSLTAPYPEGWDDP